MSPGEALSAKLRTARFLRQALGDLRLEAKLREHVTRVLAMCGNNQSLAAELLGLHRRTLQRIVRRMSRGEPSSGRRHRKDCREQAHR